MRTVTDPALTDPGAGRSGHLAPEPTSGPRGTRPDVSDAAGTDSTGGSPRLGSVRRQVVLSLGSNVADSVHGGCVQILQQAVDLLVATAGVDGVNVSSVYRTTPVGPVTDQPDFHNLVLVVETDVTPQRLLERANAVEQELGRVRTIDGGPRTIDVDIVAISDEVIDTATLTVPHPRAHERAFVLVPWLEVDPQASLVGHGPVCRIVDQMDVSGVVRTDEKVTLP